MDLEDFGVHISSYRVPMERCTVNVDGFAVVLQSERGVTAAYIVSATEAL